jgi:hypothetical protein
MQDESIKSTTEATTGLATELKKVMNSITGIGDTFTKTLNTVSQFDTKLISNARNLGQSAGYAKSVENELGKAAVNVVKMGGSLDDVLTTFKDVNDIIGKTTYLSQKFYENVEAIEKYGVKGETISSFAKFFDKVGGGMDAATEKQIELVNTSKAYGLNVGTFLGSDSDTGNTLKNETAYYAKFVNNLTIRLYPSISDFNSGINTIGFTTSNASGIQKFVTEVKNTLSEMFESPKKKSK